MPYSPSLPAGWTALWDPAGQRWAYLDANSKVIWTVPTYPSHPDAHGGDGSRGLDAHGTDPYGAHGSDPYDGHGEKGFGEKDKSGDKDKSKDKKDKSKGDKNGIMMGAAGGLAAGAVGGVLLANAMGMCFLVLR